MADSGNNDGRTLADEFGEIFGKDFRSSDISTAPLAGSSDDLRDPTRMTPVAQSLGLDLDRGTALEWGLPLLGGGVANIWPVRKLVGDINNRVDATISANAAEASRRDAAASARSRENSAKAVDRLREGFKESDIKELAGLEAALSAAVEDPLSGINDYLRHNTGYRDMDLVLDAKDGSGTQSRISVKDLMHGSRRFPKVLPENWGDPLNEGRLVAQMAALPSADKVDRRFVDPGNPDHDPVFDAFVERYRSDLQSVHGAKNGALSKEEVAFNDAVRTARMYRDYIRRSMMMDNGAPGLGELQFRPDALSRIARHGTPEGGYPAFDLVHVPQFVPMERRPMGRAGLESAGVTTDSPAVVNGRTAAQWRAEQERLRMPARNKRGVITEPGGTLRRNFGPFGHRGLSLAGILAGGALTGDALANLSAGLFTGNSATPGMTPEMLDIVRKEQRASEAKGR